MKVSFVLTPTQLLLQGLSTEEIKDTLQLQLKPRSEEDHKIVETLHDLQLLQSFGMKGKPLKFEFANIKIRATKK